MKYLKLFEDWDNDKNIADNPIIKLITRGGFTDADAFDFCEAIAVYIHEYNADEPYIHFLRNLLDEVKYKPSPIFSYKKEDISEIAQLFYDELVNTDIYMSILQSKENYKILNYLKTNDINFYNDLRRFIGSENNADNASSMGEMGYGD